MTVSHRSTAFVSCLLWVLCACSSAPELQIINEVASPMSLSIGKRFLEEGRAAEAVTAFRSTLRRQGPDLHGLNGLAIAYSELGKPEMAAEMFARALALKPNDPATLNNIGFAALRRADALLARHYLEQASALKGDFDEIEGNLTRLTMLELRPYRPSSSPPLTRAVLTSKANMPVRTLQISMPEIDPSQQSSPQPPKENPSQRSWTGLVDFTVVNDPFLQYQVAEQ